MEAKSGFREVARIVSLYLAIVILVIVFIPSSHAQLPGLPSSLPSQSSFDAIHAGNLDIGTIRLDGEVLFRVAAPTPESSANQSSKTPIERRVSSIEFHLNDIVRKGFNPDTLEIKPAILNNLVVLIASDSDWGPKQIVTVTSYDVELDEPDTIDGVARRWSEQIKEALLRAHLQRGADYQLSQLPLIVAILVSIFIVDRILHWLQKLRQSRRDKLDQLYSQQQHREQQKGEERVSMPRLSPINQTLIRLKPKLSSDHRLAINLLIRKLLFAARFSLYFLAIALILSRFPQTRSLGYWLMRVPLAYLAIPFSMVLLKSLLDGFIRAFLLRFVDHIREKGAGGELDQRLNARVFTTWKVLQQLTTYFAAILGFILVLYTLGELYIAVAILAGIVFLSQDLLKDFMKTYFILVEDQYALGDWIQVGSFSGEVVRLSLRNTQIRSASGDLHTLGNGMINEITNFTHRQSGLNLLIDVSYNTDLDQAMAVMTQVARGIREDPLWSDQIIEIKMKGVESYGDNSIIIRLVLMTSVGQQWDVGREYRRRLKPAFDAAGIIIPFPQRSIWFENALPTGSAQTGAG
jgi:small-conductance mechanosensitive channel